MDNIYYGIRHKDQATALADALQAIGERVRGARSMCDLDSAVNQLTLCLSTLKQEKDRYRHTLVQYMSDRPLPPCGFHEHAYSKGCRTCRQITGQPLNGTFVLGVAA